MKTKGMFKLIGSRVVNGRRVAISEHKLMSYYRIGTCNIPAATPDEAIAKYVECQQRSANSGQPATGVMAWAS